MTLAQAAGGGLPVLWSYAPRRGVEPRLAQEDVDLGFSLRREANSGSEGVSFSVSLALEGKRQFFCLKHRLFE